MKYFHLFQLKMEDWCKEVKEKLAAHSEYDSVGCWLWKGGPNPKKYRYGRVRTKIPASGNKSTKSEPISVHRLAYMVFHGVTELPSDKEVSHLCHKPRCIEPSHLCLEKHESNADRITCNLQGICTQNHDPPCIIRRQ